MEGTDVIDVCGHCDYSNKVNIIVKIHLDNKMFNHGS